MIYNRDIKTRKIISQFKVKKISSFFQYGAFLAIVLVLELGAGVSIFAYRAKLKEGFDKGLTDAMENYHNDNHTKISTDLDLIQKTVKFYFYLFFQI